MIVHAYLVKLWSDKRGTVRCVKEWRTFHPTPNKRVHVQDGLTVWTEEGDVPVPIHVPEGTVVQGTGIVSAQDHLGERGMTTAAMPEIMAFFPDGKEVAVWTLWDWAEHNRNGCSFDEPEEVDFFALRDDDDDEPPPPPPPAQDSDMGPDSFVEEDQEPAKVGTISLPSPPSVPPSSPAEMEEDAPPIMGPSWAWKYVSLYSCNDEMLSAKTDRRVSYGTIHRFMPIPKEDKTDKLFRKIVYGCDEPKFLIRVPVESIMIPLKDPETNEAYDYLLRIDPKAEEIHDLSASDTLYAAMDGRLRLSYKLADPEKEMPEGWNAKPTPIPPPDKDWMDSSWGTPIEMPDDDAPPPPPPETKEKAEWPEHAPPPKKRKGKSKAPDQASMEWKE